MWGGIIARMLWWWWKNDRVWQETNKLFNRKNNDNVITGSQIDSKTSGGGPSVITTPYDRPGESKQQQVTSESKNNNIGDDPMSSEVRGGVCVSHTRWVGLYCTVKNKQNQ